MVHASQSLGLAEEGIRVRTPSHLPKTALERTKVVRTLGKRQEDTWPVL